MKISDMGVTITNYTTYPEEVKRYKTFKMDNTYGDDKFPVKALGQMIIEDIDPINSGITFEYVNR